MWTKKEDDILKEEISKSPNNLAEAFRNAIKRLKDKSYATCSNRWYSVLSKQDKVFSLESDNSSVVNTKNGVPKFSIPDKNSSKEELLEYARKTYPVGTKIKSLVDGGIDTIVNTINVFNYDKEIWFEGKSYINLIFSPTRNKWAEIISSPKQPIPIQEVKPKQKGVFLDVNKLESLSIQSLRELAVTKLVDVDKKKLIDLIIE